MMLSAINSPHALYMSVWLGSLACGITCIALTNSLQKQTPIFSFILCTWIAHNYNCSLHGDSRGGDDHHHGGGADASDVADAVAVGGPDGADVHHSGLCHPLHISLVEEPLIFVPGVLLPHGHSHSLRRHAGRRPEGLLLCIVRHAAGHASFHAGPLGQRR